MLHTIVSYMQGQEEAPCTSYLHTLSASTTLKFENAVA